MHYVHYLIVNLEAGNIFTFFLTKGLLTILIKKLWECIHAHFSKQIKQTAVDSVAGLHRTQRKDFSKQLQTKTYL